MKNGIIKILNDLSDVLNEMYGYVSIEGDNFNEPSINSGPCGPFANAFFHCWNQRFKKKVHIVFIMVRNSEECWHILVRLPNDQLFDGGFGVHDEKKYADEFDIEDMADYDLDLLEKRSYGLGREYPRYCPTFSIKKVTEVIESFLEKIDNKDCG